MTENDIAAFCFVDPEAPDDLAEAYLAWVLLGTYGLWRACVIIRA